MLQQALVSPTAKLDISKLLKSSPSPSPPPPPTASIASFSRSFSGPSIGAEAQIGESPTISPTSYYPPSTFASGSLNARRPSVTGPPLSLSVSASSIKRTASTSPQESRHASKKPTRQWSDADSDKLLKLRGVNTKWDEIARHFPGRTPTACRLRYQNYLEKKYDWNDEKKKSLAVLYDRYVTIQWHWMCSRSPSRCLVYKHCTCEVLLYFRRSPQYADSSCQSQRGNVDTNRAGPQYPLACS